MRKVSRSTTPKEFEKIARKELIKATQHFQNHETREKSFTFKAYKHDSVKYELEKLFDGKCAYCESFYASTAPIDVEHFRPKGKIEHSETHPGYWWLAAEWENLLPSCIDCNRKRRQHIVLSKEDIVNLSALVKRPKTSGGKKDSFPINGIRATDPASSLAAEEALLINPALESDAPSDHIDFHLEDDVCVAYPKVDQDGKKSKRGIVSIEIYGLNRLGLVQARTALIRQLEFLRDKAEEAYAIADLLEDQIAKNGLTNISVFSHAVNDVRKLADSFIEEIKRRSERDKPYASIARLWIEKFIDF